MNLQHRFEEEGKRALASVKVFFRIGEQINLYEAESIFATIMPEILSYCYQPQLGQHKSSTSYNLFETERRNLHILVKCLNVVMVSLKCA